MAVSMPSRQHVFTACQRIEKGVVQVFLRQLEILGAATPLPSDE